jgi:superfamily II DNA helicase RecQ
MKAFNLNAKAINAVTKIKAEKEGVNILRQVQEQVSVLLVSPEMLSTPGFENMLQQKVFKERVFGLIVDEIHLLNTWGAGFRPMFLQIGYIRARFPTDTILMGLTATLRKGKHTDSVLKFLGLNREKIHLIQRSNARHDVQILIQTIRANANTEHFPQLDWVRQTSSNLAFGRRE